MFSYYNMCAVGIISISHTISVWYQEIRAYVVYRMYVVYYYGEGVTDYKDPKTDWNS
jgi:hypothetical protein